MAHSQTDQADRTYPVETEATGAQELARGWPIILTTAIGSACGMAGLSVYCLPFFMEPYKAAFGWEPSTVSVAVSLLTLGIIIFGPWAGKLCDRFGVGRVTPVSILLYAGVLASLSLVTSDPLTLYFGYFALATFGAATTYGCYSRVITRNFNKVRGLALGLTMSGPGTIAAIAPHILPRIIDANGLSWGWLSLAAAALIPLPLVLLFLRGERGSGPKASVANEAGRTLAQAVRSRQFWVIGGAIFLISTVVVGVHMQFLPSLLEMGVERGVALKMMSLYGLSIIGGRLTAAALLDWFHGAIVGGGIFLICGSGLLAMALFGHQAAYFTIIALGLAAGSEGDLIGYLTGRYFGLKAYSEIFGWLFIAMALGLMTGPFLMGLLFGASTGLLLPMGIGALLCVVATGLIACLGPYPKDISGGH